MRDLDFSRKRYALLFAVVAVAVAGVGLAALPGGDGDSSVQTGSNYTDWREVPLEDVSAGEQFTVSELEKPVLVETFAVWCPTCTRQQQEIEKFHEDTDVRSVSLNVDENEDAAKIQQHIDRHGFDWRYAVAPAGMTAMMVERYGNSIAVPPRAPAVLVCEDGTRKLPNGVKPASKLKEEIQKGC